MNAIIGYENVLVSGDAPELLTYDTWQRWRPSGSASILMQPSEPVECDYLAFGAHKLNGIDLTIERRAVAGSGAWTEIVGAVINHNRPEIYTFTPVVIGEIQITVNAATEIGVFFLGTKLTMPRPTVFSGHEPARLNPVIEYRTNTSGSGQFLSRSITRRGNETSFDFRNLDSAFVRNVLQQFLTHAERFPFFMQWRPYYEPLDVEYGYTSKPPKLTYNGMVDLLDMSLTMVGHDGI
jgi:hypothetical protein